MPEPSGAGWLPEPIAWRGAPSLAGPGALKQLLAALAAVRPVLVKQGAGRRIYRVDTPLGSFYVKHVRCQRWWQAWQNVLRGSACRREFDNLLELARRGVPVTPAVAMGERRVGGLTTDSWLITAAVPDSRTLDEILPPPNTARGRGDRPAGELPRALARLCASLHRAGAKHGDLHAGNILVRTVDTGPTSRSRSELLLVDVAAVRIGRPLAWPASRPSLVMLAAGLWDRCTARQRATFWRAYWRQRHDLPEAARAGDPAALAELLRRVTAWQRRIQRGRDKRPLRNNRSFQVVANRGGVAYALAELPRDVIERLLDNPAAPLITFAHRPAKISHTSLVMQADWPLVEQPAEAESAPRSESPRAWRVAYKRSRVKQWWKRLLAVSRRPRAVDAWQRGHALLARGIATALPIVAIVPRGDGRHDSYLATRWLDDAVDVHLYGWELARQPGAEQRRRCRRAADSLGRLLGRLHAQGVAHRDLKACNLVLSEQGEELSAWLIDLDGVAFPRRLGWHEQAQNLSRLATSATIHPCVTRTDKLRFLRSYLNQFIVDAPAWKPLWREIDRRVANHLARLRRRGKPVA